MNTEKTVKFFSKPLFKQDLKSNIAVIIAVLVIMVLMSNVVNFAMSVMGKEEITEEMKDAQESLYTHLFVMANYNTLEGEPVLSLEDFEEGGHQQLYDMLFEAGAKAADTELSAEKLQEAVDVLETSPVDFDVYLDNFQFVYAMSGAKGCFTGEELSLEDMMTNMLEMSGMSSTLIESMAEMETTTLLNQMYFHVMGLIPIFLLIVIIGNGLIVSQVDRGSLAYTLSTPTRRSAVAVTQAVFMVLIPLVVVTIVCIARIVSTKVFFGEVNVPSIIASYIGMYVLVEAISGICYLGSCFANQSRKSLAFGGGLTVWFFLAALLGLFGSQDLITMGIGVEQLGLFNNLTLVSLFDINALQTVGTDAVDYGFVWKLCVLGGVAVVTYVTGAVKFCKKDLPL